MRHDVLDLFEDAEEFSQRTMVPFGLMAQDAHQGGTDWDGVLLVNLSDGAVLMFHVAAYRFIRFADSIDGVLRVG